MRWRRRRASSPDRWLESVPQPVGPSRTIWWTDITHQRSDRHLITSSKLPGSPLQPCVPQLYDRRVTLCSRRQAASCPEELVNTT